MCNRFYRFSDLISHCRFIVNAASPYPELAGVDPNSKYAEIQGPLHDYGSYIVSCSYCIETTSRSLQSSQIHLFFIGLPRYIQQYSVVKDELTLYIPPQSVVPVLMFLRDHSQTQFKQCMDICGADYPTRSQRFEIVYHLLSIRFNARIRVKVRPITQSARVGALMPHLHTCTDIRRRSHTGTICHWNL